jgi:hypothetical protein
MERVPDGLGDARYIPQNVIVPETQHGEGLRLQVRIAALIIGALAMLAAIRLDNHALIEIDEIGDVPIDHDLTFEFEAREAFVAEH